MMFDDSLNLRTLDLDRYRLLVFQGDSGSGKSTALKFLARRYETECGLPVVETSALTFDSTRIPTTRSLVLYDETVNHRHVNHVSALLKHGNVVVVASHLHPLYFARFRFHYPTRHWWTDRDPGKIARYLERKNVVASEQAVDRYCRLYGATYTDIDIILERYPTENFDSALRHFTKFCTAHREGPDSSRQRHKLKSSA